MPEAALSSLNAASRSAPCRAKCARSPAPPARLLRHSRPPAAPWAWCSRRARAFGCRALQGVAPPYGRLGQSSRGTIGSRRFHPLRKAAYRSDGSMLLTMRAHSACPLPIPKCRSAVVTTPSAAPAAFTMVYSDVIGCERVSVTTVVGNLDGGILAAAVRAREWNDGGAISRNRARATTFEVVDSDEIGDVHGRSRLARRSSVSAGGGAEEQIEAVHPDFDEAL